ncbi:MAG: MSHA biogenesis protein MshK [Gammaproteobacteria bacterium]|nr:MSHA biogenesis protein MshK [Gammaproteobacteria bacterium]MBU1416508.1 MSHA biogenesis protein MshK [Gammaproteobacteria bacterium]
MIVAALLCAPANAWSLPDPTRPPDFVGAESAAATPAPSGLQSIIRRPHGKSAAVINGVYVELGGRIGDATLDRIGEDSVQLRSAGGRETMYLTPGVGKKIAPTSSGAAKRPPGKLEKARP